MSDTDPAADKLAAALEAKNPAMSVSRYFDQHHETVASRLQKWNGNMQDFWQIVADDMRSEGVIGRLAKDLNGLAVRQAWARYEKTSTKADAMSRADATMPGRVTIRTPAPETEKPTTFPSIGRSKDKP